MSESNVSFTIVREKPRYRTPDKTDSWCQMCQHWIRHRPNCAQVDCACGIHTCYDAGERFECLIIAFSHTGKRTHLAWAGGMEMTAERALCGIGPVDLTIDRARWPMRCEYDRVRLCMLCRDAWVQGAVYKDFP